MVNNTGIPCDDAHHKVFKTFCANKGTTMIREMHRIIENLETWPVVRVDDADERDEAEGLK